MSKLHITCENIRFYAEDGYPLSGKLYYGNLPKATIVIACATGVPQGFYRRFAEYASSFGFRVLSFDYRGIADSAPASLKKFRMSYLDWGRLDLTAAIDHAHTYAQPIFVVGHSYGGQALGLTRNHHLVNAMYCFGTGAGWHGYMPRFEKIKVQIIWNLVFPPLVALTGYVPWRKLNMGANLPKDVYQQWRKWCKSPFYFFDDPDQKNLHHDYARVYTPIYAVAALDDAWALPESRHAFMQHYRHAGLHYIDLNPEEYGLKTIGHMGYFRQGAEPIWDKMLNRFQTYLSA